MADPVVYIKFRGDEHDAVRAADKTGDSIQRLERRTHSAGRQFTFFDRDVGRASRGALAGSGAFHSLGRSIAFASASFLGAAGFTAVVRSAISEASDLHEQINKNNVVFREDAAAVLAWSKTTASSLGLAQSEALRFAGTFGNMLIPMGIAPRRAAAMSVELVKLAADMASFNNIDPSVALEKIQAGLAGMPRPLREVGVFLDQTRIKAEALTSGMVKGNVDLRKVEDAQTAVAIATAKLHEAQQKYGAGTTQVAEATIHLHKAQGELAKAVGGTTPALTQAEKTMAAYRIIMKDTAVQQGDFARTSGGLANQQRILHAQVKELEGELGRALMPTVLQLVRHLNEWLKGTLESGDAQRELRRDVRAVANAVDEVWPLIKTLAGVAHDATDAVGGLKNMLILLIGLRVATRLAGFADSISGIGLAAGGTTGAGGALGKVRGLRLALLNLAKIGTITILIEVLLNKKAIDKVGNQIDSILDDAFSRIPGYEKSAAARALRGGGVLGSKPRGGVTPGSTGADVPRGGATTSQQAKLVATAKKYGVGSGITYVWGGATPQEGFDCSGYLQYVYGKAGVRIPHNTVAQWNDPNAIHVAPGNEEPGDGVYFHTSGPGPPPQHVGFHLGGGVFIEYFSRGKPAKYNTIGAKGGYMGARRWLKIRSTGGTGGAGTGGGGAGAGAGAGAGTGSLHVGKAAKKPKAKPFDLVPLVFQERLERARLTQGMADDLKALEAINDYLTKRLKLEKDRRKRIEILRELVSVRKEIADIKGVGVGPSRESLVAQLAAISKDVEKLPEDLRDKLTPKVKAIGALFAKMVTADDRRKVLEQIKQLRKDVIEEIGQFADDAWGRVRDAILNAFDQRVIGKVAGSREYAGTQLGRAQQVKRADRAAGQIATQNAAGLTPAMQQIQTLGDAVVAGWGRVRAAVKSGDKDEIQRAVAALAEAQNQFESIGGELTDVEQAYLTAYQTYVDAETQIGEAELDDYQKEQEAKAKLARKGLEKELNKIYAQLRAGKITLAQAETAINELLAPFGLSLADLGDMLDTNDLQDALGDLTGAIEALTDLLKGAGSGGPGPPSGRPPGAPMPGRPGGPQLDPDTLIPATVDARQLIGAGGGSQSPPITILVQASSGNVQMDGELVGKVTAPVVRTEVIQLGRRIGGNVFDGQA